MEYSVYTMLLIKRFEHKGISLPSLGDSMRKIGENPLKGVKRVRVPSRAGKTEKCSPEV